MSTWLVFLAPLLGGLIGAAIAIPLARWSLQSHRRLHLHRVVTACILTPAFAALAWTHWEADRPWFSLLWVGCAVLVVLPALQAKRDRDSRADFAHDSDHCGRCGYDIRHRLGDACPECGWRLPPDPARVERRDWPLWWRGWPIGHLDNWRKALRDLVVIDVMFIGLAAWAVASVSAAGSPIVALAVAMAAHHLINTVRVVQYARRARQQVTVRSSSDGSPGR